MFEKVYVLEKGKCEYCGCNVGSDSYILTNKPAYMCRECYKGRTIFPSAYIFDAVEEGDFIVYLVEKRF